MDMVGVMGTSGSAGQENSEDQAGHIRHHGGVGSLADS